MAFVFANIALIFTDLSLGLSPCAASHDHRSRPLDRLLVHDCGWRAHRRDRVLRRACDRRLFNEPEVTALFRVLSFTFVLTALSATQVSLLTRDLAFRGLELREMAGGGARR